MPKFWVGVGVLLHPSLWLYAIRRWLISMSDVYPPRWFWPVVRIYGGPDGQESRICYMTRIILTPMRRHLKQVYLHIFHREDMDRDPHDHPFGFWTFPLNQGYYEDVFEHEDGEGCFKKVFVPRWRWSFRPAQHSHRIIATERGTWPLVTLVIRTPNVRKWGFWCHNSKETAQRHFVRYQDYVYGGVDANVNGIDVQCPGWAGVGSRREA